MYCWFRFPRTYGERKAAERDKEFVRSRRNIKNLPTEYDDEPVSARKEIKSWKRMTKRDHAWESGKNKFRRLMVKELLAYDSDCLHARMTGARWWVSRGDDKYEIIRRRLGMM